MLSRDASYTNANMIVVYKNCLLPNNLNLNKTIYRRKCLLCSHSK